MRAVYKCMHHCLLLTARRVRVTLACVGFWVRRVLAAGCHCADNGVLFLKIAMSASHKSKDLSCGLLLIYLCISNISIPLSAPDMCSLGMFEGGSASRVKLLRARQTAWQGSRQFIQQAGVSSLV